MSDGQVTGGLVRFTERIKTGDFEHREATVELHFNVLEGRDYRDLFDSTTSAAQEQSLILLGKTKRASRQQTATRQVNRPPSVSAVVEEPTHSADTAEVRPPPEPNHAVVTTGEPAVVAKTSAVEAAASMEEVTYPLALSLVPSEPTTSPAVGSTDPTAVVEDEWMAQRDITDKDLLEAITAQNAKLLPVHKEKAPLKIRELIAKYVPAGHRSTEIAQASRQKFLDELKALK